jgi:holo-[acyl-carrier protein] synthase
MSVLGIGTDIVEIERIQKTMETYGNRFLNRVFTRTEQAYCDSFNETKYLHYAARFAAKEAFSKAIGTGIAQGTTFTSIGIVNLPNGKPEIELFGALAERWDACIIHVTLSHTNSVALAVVVIEGQG